MHQVYAGMKNEIREGNLFLMQILGITQKSFLQDEVMN